MTHSAKAKFSKMSARAKKLLLLRIYMYAVASGNTKLLSMLRVKSSHKTRRHRRRKHRKGRKSRRKGRRRKGKLHGAAKRAFLRRMAAGRRKARRR